jgi:FkbM family methyltransferase
MTAKSIEGEMPLTAKAYMFYDKEILPEINHIRGTVRLHGILKKIGVSSIVRNTRKGFRLDAVGQEPVFSDKLDAKYVFIETKYLDRFLEATEDTHVFCDVGGYHGFYSLVSDSKKSIVFEADPSNAQHIRENIELNPGQDIELVEKAVWSSNSSVEFEAEGSGTSHISEKGIEREAVTLDSFFEDIEDPDVVKIDVEGVEGHVLEGAEKVLERSKPKIFLEIHLRGRTDSFGFPEEELLSILEDFGYEVVFSENRGGEKLVIFE